MIEQDAHVIAAQAGMVTVEVTTQSSCSSCATKTGCGTGALSKVLGNKKMLIELENNLQLKIGDRVIVGLEERALVLGSLMIYLLPLLGFFVAAIGADYLSDIWAVQGEWLTIVGGICGLIISFLVIRNIASRADGKQINRPVLLRRAHE